MTTFRGGDALCHPGRTTRASAAGDERAGFRPQRGWTGWLGGARRWSSSTGDAPTTRSAPWPWTTCSAAAWPSSTSWTGATPGSRSSAGDRLAGLSSARRPTAFCLNDLVALGLLQQAIGSGTRVPERLAIVGYDDIDFAAAAAVPLTSVRQPRQELGARAAALVLDEATGTGHTHQQVLFTPELIARQSTRS